MTTHNSAEGIAKEYEDFVYIVSHDLNAPLRHVKEFTHLLVGVRRENLSDEEREYIVFLEKSLAKLDKMQDALVIFSRLGTRAGPKKNVDCNLMVEQVLADLEGIVKSQRAIVKRETLPSIVVDCSQFYILFHQLIENALRFHDTESPVRIDILCRQEDKSCIFCIKDNGIGIAEEFHVEVFRMFRRLMPDKYPGIGAGLTIARKIVHRHGGDIWIESDGKNGTSVFFSVPVISIDAE